MEEIYHKLRVLAEEAGMAGAVLLLCDDPMTYPSLIVAGLGVEEARELLCRGIVRSYSIPTEMGPDISKKEIN